MTKSVHNHHAAFLLAAPASGAGKTTLCLGLLAALKGRGLRVQPFKCGPDFIDPTLHRMVTGTVSRNLDIRMCGPDFVRCCFERWAREAEISVVEGVMGLFDGGDGSGAALAKHLGLPVILLVDVQAAAESIAALVKGFEEFDPQVNIAGLILNQVGSPTHLELLKKSIAAHCRTEILGSLSRDQEFHIPDRHLGLMMGNEHPLGESTIQRLAESVSQQIDLNRLLELSRTGQQPITGPFAPDDVPEPETKVRIGVARDEAFCFYYQDNLDLLEEAGAELVFFSPLHDRELPKQLDGLYLGGGYPELHARELSENRAMRQAILEWSLNSGPLFAECGGFMYLCEGISTKEDQFFPMAGIFPVKAWMQQRLSRLGYRSADLLCPSLFGARGRLHGHEFHYSDIEEMPASIPRAFVLEDGRQEGYQIRNTLAGYIHFHFGGSPEKAKTFVRFCRAIAANSGETLE